MRRLVLIAIMIVPLAGATPAVAKEVQVVMACGSGDCSTSRAAGFLRAMRDVGPPTDAPPRPARFYWVTITVGDGDEIAGRDRLAWVPSLGRLLTVDGMWIAARPAIRRGLDGLTRGLAALPAARLPGFPTAPPPSSPVSSPPASSPRDVPVVPIVAAAMTVLIAGLLARRRVGRGPSRPLPE